MNNESSLSSNSSVRFPTAASAYSSFPDSCPVSTSSAPRGLQLPSSSAPRGHQLPSSSVSYATAAAASAVTSSSSLSASAAQYQQTLHQTRRINDFAIFKRRQKIVNQVKLQSEYINYRQLLKKEKRRKGDPESPDVYETCSTNSFAVQVRDLLSGSRSAGFFARKRHLCQFTDAAPSRSIASHRSLFPFNV